MLLSPPHPRALRASRQATTPTALPARLRRRFRRLSIEALEQRVVLSDITAAGLTFHLVPASASDTTQLTLNTKETDTVQIGFTDTKNAFTPVLDVTGGFELDSKTTNGAITYTSQTFSGSSVPADPQGATTPKNNRIFAGVHAFTFGTDAATPANPTLKLAATPAGNQTSTVVVDGFTMQVSQLGVAAGKAVQASGSFSGYGLTLPLLGKTVPINATGPTLPSFSVTLGGGNSFSLSGFNLSLGSSSATATVGYDSSSGVQAFYVGGSATLPLPKAVPGSLSLSLGDSSNNNEGIVFDANGVESVSASITSNFTIKSAVTVATQGLGLTYNRNSSTDTFGIFGAATVSASSGKTLQSVSASFGTSATPGVEIGSDGSLTSLDVILNGTFNLGGVTVAPTGLELKYDSSAPADFTIIGGLDVKLSSTIEVSANLTEPLTIDTATGAVSLTNGFGIHVHGDFKGFHVDAMITYTSPAAGQYDVVASGSLTFENIGFEAYLHIKDGKLTDIGLGVDGKVAVGDTGLFITWIYGSVNNLDTDDPTITAATTVVYGDANILRVTGAVQIKKEGLILTADPGTPPDIYTSGQVDASQHPLGVYLLDGVLGTFAGSVDLDWADGIYMAHVSGSLYDGLINIDAGIVLTSSGDLSLAADGDLAVPSFVPVIHGYIIAGGSVRLVYKNHGDLSQSYIAAWGNIGPFEGGFEYTFDNHLKYLDGNAIAALQNTSTTNTYTGPAYQVNYPITVPADTSSIQITLSDNYLDQIFPGLTSPNGLLHSGSVKYANNNFVKITDPNGLVTDLYLSNTPAYSNGVIAPGPELGFTPASDPLRGYPGTSLFRGNDLCQLTN